MLDSFAAWLGGTSLTAFLENQAWAIPAIQTVHILAVALVMAAVAIINLRVLGVVERGQSLGALAARFLPPSAAALIVLALTGLLLIAGEPTRAIFRYVFWAKMGMLAAVIALTVFLLAGLRSNGVATDPAARASAPFKGLAVLGLLMWTFIIFAGRWIGYAQGWPGSPQ